MFGGNGGDEPRRLGALVRGVVRGDATRDDGSLLAPHGAVVHGDDQCVAERANAALVARSRATRPARVVAETRLGGHRQALAGVDGGDLVLHLDVEPGTASSARARGHATSKKSPESVRSAVRILTTRGTNSKADASYVAKRLKPRPRPSHNTCLGRPIGSEGPSVCISRLSPRPRKDSGTSVTEIIHPSFVESRESTADATRGDREVGRRRRR